MNPIGTTLFSLVILIGLTLSSLRCYSVNTCDSENDIYKHSVKVCQDLEKASNAASVTLAIVSATLNPIGIAAAFTAAASAAKAAEHNCKIRDNKELTLIGCLNLLNKTLIESIQSSANSYTQTEKQIEMTKVWQSANLQHQDRLFNFLNKNHIEKQKPLLLSEEWLSLDEENLKKSFDQIKNDHRALINKVKTYEAENKIGSVVKTSWN